MTNTCPRAPRKFELYVPTKDNSRREVKKSVINHFRNKMNDHFGGATVFSGEGCYLTKDHPSGRQCEEIKIMTAIRADINCAQAKRDDAVMHNLSDDIAQYLGQDGVFYAIWEVATEYVEGEKRPRAYPELLF